MDPRILTTIGLAMDMLGIALLFRYGAWGGYWIDKPMPTAIDLLVHNKIAESHASGPALEVVYNRRSSRKGAWWGLGVALAGFALQIVAQWL